MRSAIQARADFNVVGEAEDGLEAVQKAADLQPDLILLDIGLPKLNGMAAAAKIRILAPAAKILFISLESSCAVVEEAFNLGAQGYIHKLRVHSELVPGIEAVLAGRHFVSSDLKFGDGARPDRRHEMQFYSDEQGFLESVSRFIAPALKADGGAIVIATSSHREGLIQRLKADALDMAGLIQKGTYISLDVAEAFSHIIVNGVPDRGRFLETFSAAIESCVKATKTERPRVAVVGEGATLMHARGNINAAIQLERISNELLETHVFDCLCPYPLSAFPRPDHDESLRSICAEHTTVSSR